MARQSKTDYYEYLASREWRLKRKQVIERAGGTCERCSCRPIKNVHHLTYERVGNELLSDLQGVCRECHEYLSAEREDDPATPLVSPAQRCWRNTVETLSCMPVGDLSALLREAEFICMEYYDAVAIEFKDAYFLEAFRERMRDPNLMHWLKAAICVSFGGPYSLTVGQREEDDITYGSFTVLTQEGKLQEKGVNWVGVSGAVL